jgi:hypothetical protein
MTFPFASVTTGYSLSSDIAGGINGDAMRAEGCENGDRFK